MKATLRGHTFFGRSQQVTNAGIDQVHANVLERPVLVPAGSVVSLGSAIFAFLAAGVFSTVVQAQDKICPRYRTSSLTPHQSEFTTSFARFFSKIYFALGQPHCGDFGNLLPELIHLAESQHAKAAD